MKEVTDVYVRMVKDSDDYDDDSIVVIETDDDMRYVFKYRILDTIMEFSHRYDPKKRKSLRRNPKNHSLPEKVYDKAEEFGTVEMMDGMAQQAIDNEKAVVQ